MPKTEGDPLGPSFSVRLRAELDRVRPRETGPRYAAARPRVAAFRVAPVVLAIALTGVLGLTAWATTGRTNPAVWTQRVETVINPPAPSPTPESTPGQAQPQAAPVAAPTHKATPSHEADQKPQPSATPEPRESPEPDEDQHRPGHDGRGLPPGAHPSPTPPSGPSPSPGDH